MLSGDGNENGPKKSVGLISKQLCTCSTLFLFISLPLFCTTTTRNFQKLPRYTSYVFLFTCFFVALIFTWMAASISPISYLRYKMSMFFFPYEIGLLCVFISRSSSFSVIYVNVDIKINSKERIGFVVVVFISKSPGNYAIYYRC